jgi:hypothetical protein
MTPERAITLESGTTVYVASRHPSLTPRVYSTKFRRVVTCDLTRGATIPDRLECEIEPSVWVYSDRIHLTEDDARTDMRHMIHAEICKLQDELYRWA